LPYSGWCLTEPAALGSGAADTDLSSPEYEHDFGRIWQHTDKVVFSPTLTEVQGKTRIARDDITEEITRLKQKPGKDMEVVEVTEWRFGV
jgi:hypothetical protein